MKNFLHSPRLPIPTKGVAVITGATSGIGRATATALIHHAHTTNTNFHIIGSTRDPAHVTDPIPGVDYVALDLEQPTSIAHFAQEVLDRGTPSILVNNAGESQSGPLEELPREAVERLFQVNVIGHIDLTQHFLPAMRAAGQGRIIMIGSMLGSFPLAYRSSYVASKAALKGFVFAARRELHPFGIGMSVMEPGAIATGLSARRTTYIDKHSVYNAEFTQMLTHLNHNESTGITPERVANHILTALFATRPKPLYAIGSLSQLAFPISRLLPLETMHGLINKKHGL